MRKIWVTLTFSACLLLCGCRSTAAPQEGLCVRVEGCGVYALVLETDGSTEVAQNADGTPIRFGDTFTFSPPKAVLTYTLRATDAHGATVASATFTDDFSHACVFRTLNADRVVSCAGILCIRCSE